MIAVRQTEEFTDWIDGLRDRRARLKIITRITRAESGLLGDVKYFDGIGEMRIDFGPGYRLYFVQKGSELLLLLCGGDKDSQDRDIRLAKKLASSWEG